MGSDPGFKMDLSWKNLIGQASGESYMFEWTRGATVVIQPNERKSGIDIGMDGKGGKPTKQDNHLFRQDGNQMFNNMGGGNNGGGMFGGQQGGQQGGLGGLGNILGGIINS
jgi:hypothetical protein